MAKIFTYVRRGFTEVGIYYRSELYFITAENINIMLSEESITLNIYNRLIIIDDNKLSVSIFNFLCYKGHL